MNLPSDVSAKTGLPTGEDGVGYMNTNAYSLVRGGYAERKAKLDALPKRHLEAIVLDRYYNDFLSSRANYESSDNDPRGHGKRLPYIGWYWRHLEFSYGTLPIGDCGEFIGFIANNKWDYPERNTTPDEFTRIMEIIDAAIFASQQGGDMSLIERDTNAKLDELWDYLQTLAV